MSGPTLPGAKAIHVDTRGALILDEESPDYASFVHSHADLCLQIGGSLAKVVYFTRSPEPPKSPSVAATRGSGSSAASDLSSPISSSPPRDTPVSGSPTSSAKYNAKLNGALTPAVLENGHASPPAPEHPLLDHRFLQGSLLRRASVQHFPGGQLNFERYETEHIDACVEFIQGLIEHSAALNGVPIAEMRRSVKIMATGGGAHKFHELFGQELCVEVRREDEMECLIEGLKFITLIPDEVYYFSDELIDAVSHPGGTLERPSPNPPKYAVTFVQDPTPQLPCLLVNIGSGVSIIKVDEDGTYERVSGTKILELSEKGDNSKVDMLVGDIYGSDYSKLGLKSTMIASSFGKVFKNREQKGTFTPEDISKSLLYAVSNNIGQIAYMNAEKYNLERIYFGGFYIRGHAATISTLSYAIRFWSKGTKRAMFLRHEGFLGAIGAWIKNIGEEQEEVSM
ncbi:fumble-domain-containing protein [Fomitopsis serialis]|uniref:fumble-domain-containing protein n=1 Tax=Fomitopsis serialis TaxID=139415 RepID=UPI00200892C3|nr:fumble-domain-containing protein [Neoantrodia serialis]KAH9929742.1 fumble-domain-containing protein [Neoantrodia serialis]